MELRIISPIDSTGRIKLESNTVLKNGYTISWYKVNKDKIGQFVKIKGNKHYLNNLQPKENGGIRMHQIINNEKQLKLANKLNKGTYKAWVSVSVLLYMKELKYDLAIHDKAFGRYLVTIHS